MPINNPYASLDPFRDINRQLRAVGISPLNMGPLQFPDFTQQQQRRMQDAAIVRERNAPHMYVNPVLSGLEWTGRKLDALTGLRGIKGLLAGKPREALSAIPIIGTFGDELGVTDPEQYTEASELLEPLGLDDSLTASILTDVALDPMTWLTLGAYGAAKGTAKAAASTSGKALGKTGYLKSLVDMAGDKNKYKALGLDAPMGPREFMMKTDLDTIIKRDKGGHFDTTLRDPSKGLTRSAGTSPIEDALRRQGADVDSMIASGEKLGSWGAVGVPFRKKHLLPARAGGLGERYAKTMDKFGRGLKAAKPFVFGRRLFDPAAGGARTIEVQEAAMRQHDAMMRVEQEVGEVLAGTEDALRKHPEFDPDKIREKLGPDTTDAQVQDYILKNIDHISHHAAGYEFDDLTGLGTLPEFSEETVTKVYQRLSDSISKRLKRQQDKAAKASKADVEEVAEGAEGVVDRFEQDLVGDQELLESIKTIDGQTRTNISRAINRLNDIGEGVGGGFGPEYLIQGGVHGRVAPKLPEHLQELEPFLKNMIDRKNAVFEFGKESGLHVDELKDAFALHHPRKTKQIPANTLAAKKEQRRRRGRMEQVDETRRIADETALDTTSAFQIERDEAFRGIFGDLAGIRQMWSDIWKGTVKHGDEEISLRSVWEEGGGNVESAIPLFGLGLLREGGYLDSLRKIATGTNDRLNQAVSEIDAAILNMGSDIDEAGRAQLKALKARREKYFDQSRVASDAIGDLLEVGDDGRFTGEWASGIKKFIEDPSKNSLKNSKLRSMAAFFATRDPDLKMYGSPFVMNPAEVYTDYTRSMLGASHGARMSLELAGAEAIIQVLHKGDVHSRSLIDMLDKWNLNTPIAKVRLLQGMVRGGKKNVLLEAITATAEANPSRFKKNYLNENTINSLVRSENIGRSLDKLRNKADFNFSIFEQQLDDALRQMTVPRELGQSLDGYMEIITNPKAVSDLAEKLDVLTDFFKTSFTTPWPAFHMRNAISAAVNNFYAGAKMANEHNPIKAFLKPYRMARQLLTGGAIKGIAKEIPRFKNRIGQADEYGRIIDDAYVTDWIRQQIRANRIAGGGQYREELISQIQRGDPRSVFPQYDIPGAVPFKQRWRETGQPRHPGDERKWGQRKVHQMRELGNEVENYARISPFIAFLSQGDEVVEAARKVKMAQVDYQALSDFERRWMRRLIPFYTFTRRQIPFVYGNLLDFRSPMSQAVRHLGRAKSRSRDPDRPEPEWLANTLALPFGEGEGGKQRYLTGLGGFMGGAEDVLSLIKPGATPMSTAGGTVRGILGRGHPLGQMLAEAATGYSLFAGRPLSELTPPTAKLIQQVTGSESLPSTPGPLAEVLLQRVPGYGRAVSTLRTLTDPNRPISGEQGSLLNLAARLLPATTGIRIKDVDLDRIKYRLQQESIEAQLRENPNVRSFTHIYIPDDVLATMSEEEQALYALYKQLQSEASKASRQRAKEEEGIQTPPAAAPQSPRSSGGSLRYLQRPVSELVNDAIGRPLL